MDIERFHELAGFFEYDEGMTRFRAEELAAHRLGVQRWEAINAISKRNSQCGGDIRQAPSRDAANAMPVMQSAPSEQGGQVLVGHVSDGRGDVVLSSLSELPGRRVLR